MPDDIHSHLFIHLLMTVVGE